MHQYVKSKRPKAVCFTIAFQSALLLGSSLPATAMTSHKALVSSTAGMDTFKPGGSLKFGGRYAAAMVRNGKVLLIHGTELESDRSEDPSNVPGAQVLIRPINTEFYDPKTQSSTKHVIKADHPEFRRRQAFFLPDGKLFCMHGTHYEGHRPHMNQVYFYDPLEGGVTFTGGLERPYLSARPVPLKNGEIFLSGLKMRGDRITVPITTIYNPATGINREPATTSKRKGSFSITLLDDGKVLITGGFFKWPTLTPTAELYDPKADRWISTGSMATARNGHSATLLLDGTVLIAGGGEKTAELYDPKTRTFNSVGSMNEARTECSITLLANGKVLFAGGEKENRSLNSAELYDPATRTFAPTAPLGTARKKHTALTLPNGHVMIAGGLDNNGNDLSSVEIFVPGEMDSAGAPTISTQPRSKKCLEGERVTFRVEAKGEGSLAYQWYCNGAPLVEETGRTLSVRASATAQHGFRYSVCVKDKRGWVISEEATLHVHQPSPAIESFKARQYLLRKGEQTLLTWAASGANSVTLEAPAWKSKGFGEGKNSLEIEPLEQDTTFTLTARNYSGNQVKETVTLRLADFKADPPVIAKGGKSVLLPVFPEGQGHISPGVGAVQSGVPVEVSPELTTNYFLTVTNGKEVSQLHTQVNPSGALSMGRNAHTATLLSDGKILIAGGYSKSGKTASAEIYDPNTLRCTPSGSMATARVYHAAARLSNGKVLIVGGHNGKTAELYDPADGQFKAAGETKEGRDDSAQMVALQDGTLLILGGAKKVPAELYDPKTGTFQTIGEPIEDQSPTSILLPDGKVFIGGEDKNWLYNPKTQRFQSLPTIPEAGSAMACALLPSGRVLAAYMFQLALFDPETERFTLVENTPWRGFIGSLTTLKSGKTLIIDEDGLNYCSDTYLFDEKTLDIKNTNLLLKKTSFKVTALPNGLLLLSGGSSSAKEARELKDTELLDPAMIRTQGVAKPKKK